VEGVAALRTGIGLRRVAAGQRVHNRVTPLELRVIPLLCGIRVWRADSIPLCGAGRVSYTRLPCRTPRHGLLQWVGVIMLIVSGWRGHGRAGARSLGCPVVIHEAGPANDRHRCGKVCIFVCVELLLTV
jgi:hypothetical protein